jgi:hypothetical protein
LAVEPAALRDYILVDYLLLYAQISGVIYLLAIRHQRQLSFDFEAHWGGATGARTLGVPARQSPVGRVSTRHQPISHPVGLKPDLQG